MRIYLAEGGKQLLADLRSEGGGRDIALGTLDYGRAAVLVAGKLRDLTAASPQLVLLPTSIAKSGQLTMASAGTYRLSHCLAYFVDFGDHRREATREAHRTNVKYLRAAFSDDPDIAAVDWYHLAMQARAGWKKRQLSNDTCNKRLGTLSRALRLAFRPLGGGKRYLTTPAVLPDQLPTETIARDRWLTPEELRAMMGKALTFTGNDARGHHLYPEPKRKGRAFRIGLRAWMGCRNADARTARVKHFNLLRGTWLRHAQKRNTPPTWLQMPEPMAIFVESWLSYAGYLGPEDRILYPWPDEHRGLNILARALRIEPLTPHDYRRTAAHLVRLCGLDKDYCRRWLGLGAKSPMLDQVYLQDDPLAVPDPERVRAVMARLGVAVTPRASEITVDYTAPRPALPPLPAGTGIEVPVYGATVDEPNLLPTSKRTPPTNRGAAMSRTYRREAVTSQNPRRERDLRGRGIGEPDGTGVPRDRVELSTHGFSGRADTAENTQESRVTNPVTSTQPPASHQENAHAGRRQVHVARRIDEHRAGDGGELSLTGRKLPGADPTQAEGWRCGHCGHAISPTDTVAIKAGRIVGCEHCPPQDAAPRAVICTRCGAQGHVASDPSKEPAGNNCRAAMAVRS